MNRAAQREQTRDRIVEAAVEVFASHGFDGAGTRAIAEVAGVTQGLLTYHFPSKDELWRAAADRIFDLVATEVVDQMRRLPADVSRDTGREYVRIYVRFVARHPEVLHFMVDAQADPAGRCAWLVDSHLRRQYEDFGRTITRFDPTIAERDVPHIFYSMVGAGSLVFGLSEEVRLLTDLDTRADSTIEAHADIVARLILP